MPFAAAASTAANTKRAIAETCAAARSQLPGQPDLAVVFFSAHHVANATTIAAAIQKEIGPRAAVGCMGESVVANDREIEHQPAVSLWLAKWNEPVELEAFHLVLERTPEGVTLLGWPDSLLGIEPTQAALLLLGDPLTFPVDLLLHQVNANHAGLRVMGGMASGDRGTGEMGLLKGTDVVRDGAVGVLLHGPIRIRSIVSQGCRPIGRHYVITKGRGHVIAELSGKPPLVHLQELWEQLSPRDQQLVQQGLHIGRVISEYKGDFRRGDFLVRNVMGADPNTGMMEITDTIRVGQTVQFHVRDAETADEDLKSLLQMEKAAHEKMPAGALLFTCNGRGSRMFPEPHHDAQAIRGELGAIPLAGFFAAGELGPIGGLNFIHGFTASAVLFED